MISRIKIGGNIYTIKVVPDDQLGNNSGETDPEKLTIRLSDKHTAEGALPSLLHEVLHAINIERSELDVEHLAQAVHQVLVDNQEFTKLFIKND